MAVDNLERLLGRYAYPDWLRRHSEGVREVASALAEALLAAGRALDRDVAVGAALLHDIGKTPLLGGDPREHAELSAIVLAGEGLAPLVEPARRHIFFSVLDRGRAPRTLEEKVVYYADHRFTQEPVTFDERVRDLVRRYPESRDAIRACLEPARAIERELFAGLPIVPEDLCARR